MLTQKQIDKLNNEVAVIYAKIELELMKDIARRLKSYDDVTGSLEYHIKKLEELGALNNDAVKTITRYAGMSEQAVRKMLLKASVANISSEDAPRVAPMIQDIVEDSIKDVNNTLMMIQTRTIQSTKDTYMNILNKAYLEVSSGIYSYNEAIQRGVKEMAKNGLNGASYMRKNGTVVNYSIESVVRRDTLTAVNQLANKVSIDNASELGYEYMEVSSHFGARHDATNPINDHVHWQGKVYKINGFDEKHDNFYTATGYGQLLGLGGVNCRHRAYPYKLGTARASEHLDESLNNALYDKEQKQRRLERAIRTTKKEIELAKEMEDTQQVLLLKKVLKDQYAVINQYCKANGLKRNWNREMIASELKINTDEYKFSLDLQYFSSKEHSKNIEDIRKDIISKRDNLEITINQQKQNTHLIGTYEHEMAMSKRLVSHFNEDITIEKLQEIINTRAGTGTIKYEESNGRITEVLEIENSIAKVYNVYGQEEFANQLKIHYSKTGAHIVPRKERKQ